MSYFLFTMISALSIALPCIAGLFHFKQILLKRNLPLFILLFVGLINETISFLMIKCHKPNLLNSNVFTFIEYLIYVWLFMNIRSKGFKSIWIGLFIGITTWVLDNFILHSLYSSNSLFRIVSSLMICWFCIDRLSELTITVVADRFKKIDLLLCLSLLAYFTFRGFILIFKQFAPIQTADFYTDLWIIIATLNILVNISFSIVILCLPKAQRTTRSS